jgi:hypothetical protein
VSIGEPYEPWHALRSAVLDDHPARDRIASCSARADAVGVAAHERKLGAAACSPSSSSCRSAFRRRRASGASSIAAACPMPRVAPVRTTVGTSRTLTDGQGAAAAAAAARRQRSSAAEASPRAFAPAT